jgi:hypothetical protein
MPVYAVKQNFLMQLKSFIVEQVSSFTQPIEKSHLAYNMDQSLSITRVETVRKLCDAHLGHVFPD